MPLANRSNRSPTRADADALAVRALSFLVAEPERLGGFLAETGLGPESVRDAAGTPGFLPAVLDYLIANEAMLVEFARECDLNPVAIVAARRAMSDATE